MTMLTGTMSAMGINFFIGLCFITIVSDYVLRKACRALNRSKYQFRGRINFLFGKLKHFGITNPWLSEPSSEGLADGEPASRKFYVSKSSARR